MGELGPRRKLVHLRDESWRRIVESEKAVERSFHEGRLFVSLAVGVLLVGFLLVGQWRGYASLSSDLSRQSDQSLGIIIEEITAENSELRNEVLRLELRMFEAQREEIDRSDLLNEAAKELTGLRVMAGLSAATGPGVVIVIEDEENVLLAQDFVALVHELRAGGAEAIAVDGKRVIGTSGFVGEGTDLKMDGTTLAGSYRVVALGSPSDLQQAVELPGGFTSTLSTFPGVTIEVTQEDSLMVPAADTIRFVYGEPIPK